MDSNIERLKSIVEELTIRDEQIFREHNIYEKIVMLVLDGIWIIDQDNNTIFINDKMATMLGFTAAEISDKNMFSFMPEEDQMLAKKNIEKRKRVTENSQFFKFIRKDGTIINTQITTAPLFKSDKIYRGVIAYVKEVETKEMINFYKQMFFDVSLDALLIVDFNGIIIDANFQYYSMLGYTKEETIGRHYIDLVNFEDKGKSEDVFKELTKGNDLTKFINELICKDRSKITVSWRAKSLLKEKLIFANARKIN